MMGSFWVYQNWLLFMATNAMARNISISFGFACLMINMPFLCFCCVLTISDSSTFSTREFVPSRTGLVNLAVANIELFCCLHCRYYLNSCIIAFVARKKAYFYVCLCVHKVFLLNRFSAVKDIVWLLIGHTRQNQIIAPNIDLFESLL